MLNCWAKENGIKRLELTVECCNETARHLYEKVVLRLREQGRNPCSSTAPLLMNFIWQKFCEKEMPDAEALTPPRPGILLIRL